MRNSSLTFKFCILLTIITLLIAGSSYSTFRNIYYDQLKAQGRNIADNMQAFGIWVAQYGRIWVTDSQSSFLSHLSTHSVENGDIELYSKNPVLAQREFSEVVESLPINAKFRMTSHNYMNPSNRPDKFESKALSIVRSQNLREYDRVVGDVYRYVQTVYHEKSCIVCHGDPEDAPADVTSRYGITQGFGFKEGDVAGIISVRIPMKPLMNSVFKYFGVKEFALVLAAFLVMIFFMRYFIIKPILRLTTVSEKISIGEDVDLRAGSIPETTNNELDQLTLSINRLYMSIQVAVKSAKKKQQQLFEDE